MEKKSWMILAFLLINSFLAVPLANAAPIDFRGPMEDAMQIFKDFFGPIFEAILGVSQFNEDFFARVLLFLLLVAVIYTTLGRIELFSNKPGLVFIVAIIVSLIGTRTLPEEYVSGMLIPYGTVAVAISVLLPFLIFFFFVYLNINSTIFRRFAWLIFALIFIGLWYNRATTGGGIGGMNWVYTIGIIAVILSLIFDPQIKRYFGLAELRRATRHLGDRERVRLLQDYQRALEIYNRTRDPAARREVERIARQLHLNTRFANFGGGI